MILLQCVLLSKRTHFVNKNDIFSNNKANKNMTHYKIPTEKDFHLYPPLNILFRLKKPTLLHSFVNILKNAHKINLLQKQQNKIRDIKEQERDEKSPNPNSISKLACSLTSLDLIACDFQTYINNYEYPSHKNELKNRQNKLTD